MSYLFYGDIGHEPSLEPPESSQPDPEDVVATCSECEQPILLDETYYDFGDRCYCSSCMEYARR